MFSLCSSFVVFKSLLFNSMFLFLGSTSVALHDLQLSVNVSSVSPLSTVLNELFGLLFLLFLLPDWLLPAKDRFEQLVV